MKISPNLLWIPLAIGSVVALGSTQQDQSCCGMMAMQTGGPKVTQPFQAKQLKDKQTAAVTIDNGYSPSVIQVQVGKPVELTFTGGKNIGCGGTVVFKSLKISKDVPVGKSVTVKFTPKAKGEIPFTCSMGMLSGKVVVK